MGFPLTRASASRSRFPKRREPIDICKLGRQFNSIAGKQLSGDAEIVGTGIIHVPRSQHCVQQFSRSLLCMESKRVVVVTISQETLHD